MAIHYVQSQQTETLENAIHQFLSAVRLENEQEGQEGEALELLTTFLRRYGKEFVGALSTHLSQQNERESDIATTLTWLGRVEHPKTQTSRLNLIVENLSAQQVRIRDGAVAGLAYMMNKSAIPALEVAAKSETNRHVRRDMEHLLKLLMEM